MRNISYLALLSTDFTEKPNILDQYFIFAVTLL